jgi:ABC-type uncharacterized transport system YnjBCD ATPase subunit
METEFVLTYAAETDGAFSAILHRKRRNAKGGWRVDPVTYSGGHRSKREARAALQDVLDGFVLLQTPFAGLRRALRG